MSLWGGGALRAVIKPSGKVEGPESVPCVSGSRALQCHDAVRGRAPLVLRVTLPQVGLPRTRGLP
jgi:hypothetical protein